MHEWDTAALGDVADLCLGKILDQKKNRGDELPYLANVNVRWGEFALDELRMMRFEDRELERYGLRYGDIVMCEGGEPGRCAIWKEQVPGMMIQKALHRIRPKSCLDHRLLYYNLRHIGLSRGFDQYFTGATIKHLPGEKLAKIKVCLPPLTIQRRIAGILSAYDNLIENSQRRIKILEEMARRLYREWFVHFRFLGHEGCAVVDSSLGGDPGGVGGEAIHVHRRCPERGALPRLILLTIGMEQFLILPLETRLTACISKIPRSTSLMSVWQDVQVCFTNLTQYSSQPEGLSGKSPSLLLIWR
jgi:hypothetical protein